MARPAPPEIPKMGDERTTLIAFLEFYRAALLDRAWGLDEDQLRIKLPPSPLSLSGLIVGMSTCSGPGVLTCSGPGWF